MPHARHGGIGVREATAGSKLDGTGFEKEQMGQTHVALAGAGAGAGLPWRDGVDDEELWTGAETPRVRCLEGFGKSVILADDLRKPACPRSAGVHPGRWGVTWPSGSAAYIEVGLLDVLQQEGDRVAARGIVVDIAHTVRGQIGLAILALGELGLAIRAASPLA